MSDFVTLTCLSCGGKLEITKDIERFACGYCGNEQIVRRGGGIVSLAPLIDEIKKIQTGVDKTSAELAITRLKNEIEELNTQFSVKIQNLFRKYETNDGRFGYIREVALSIMLLLEKRDKIKISLTENNKILIQNRLSSLNNEDIDFIVFEIRKFAIFPKIYDKQIYKDFFNELTSMKELIKEKDIVRNQKEAEIDKLLQIVIS